MKILIEICYNGSAYHGFQVQKNAVTVQSTLQRAVETTIGCACRLTGCSRTDSGVHAKQFYCTVEPLADITIPDQRLPVALNSRLPDDISVLSAKRVPDDFHPRYSAQRKEYSYLYWNGEYRNPFLVGRAWHISRRLDDNIMNEAAGYFTGKHDFTSFSAAASDAEDKIRTIYNCTVTREGDIVRLNISGNGFLYNMVRIIAGTLADVSDGRYKPDEIVAMIERRDRSAAGITAPASGLYLENVIYS